MAKTEEILTDEILEILLADPGLEFGEIARRVGAGNGLISERGVRNLLNRLEQDEKVVKQKRWGKKQGAPPYVYFHPDTAPRQLSLNFLQETLGIETTIQTKAQVEAEDIEHDERKRLEKARSVLESIAKNHLDSDKFALAITRIAPKLAHENPVELLLEMVRWTVQDLNNQGETVIRLTQAGRMADAQEKAGELNIRLKRTRDYFQRFWRLDNRLSDEDAEGILDIPSQAKNFVREGKRAVLLNEEKARERLQQRIRGDKVIECRVLPTDLYKSAAGTDASVADIWLEHSQGSFIPPDPVVVTAAAATLKTRDGSGKTTFEYQDFDIFPDGLRKYADYTAATEGLVISPALKQMLPEEDFKHSRMAAMELRQYFEDFRIATKDADWRPFGKAPDLGMSHRPKLIIRDGRVFPLVHRLNDYEDDGLYGHIVRSEIEKFKQVFHNTVLDPDAGFVYGAAVKSPELSWLSPLVFWYLHKEGIRVENSQKLLVEATEVYRPPFADTAVTHLLFLGMANDLKEDEFSLERHFISCRAIRRFSDIALGEGNVIHEDETNPLGPTLRRVKENDLKDWEKFIRQSIAEKQRTGRGGSLDPDDYEAFIYLCSKAGVSACYAAPTSAYKPLVQESGGEHFLIPRLEVAVNLTSPNQSEQESFDGLLSWLAGGGWDLDRNHTQSSFDTGDRENSLPILTPDVTIAAHETVTFARDRLGEEVLDEIRSLITELRKRAGKGR